MGKKTKQNREWGNVSSHKRSKNISVAKDIQNIHKGV